MKKKLLLISLFCVLIIGIVIIFVISSNDEYDATVQVGELYEWGFKYEGKVEELVITATDKSLVEIIYTDPIINGAPNMVRTRVKALNGGKTTITATSSVDDRFKETLNLTIEKDDLVYISEGQFINNITITNSTAELYKDDTLVTYTITTSNLVDQINLIMIDSSSSNYPIRSFGDVLKVRKEGLVYELYKLEISDNSLTSNLIPYDTGSNGKVYSATREENGENSVWTIRWNLGNTAVKFVEINANDLDTGESHQAYAHLDIHYPKVDVSKGLEPLINLWVKNNVDGPLYFELDTSTLTNDEKYNIYTCNMPNSLFLDEIEVLLGLPRTRADIKASSYGDIHKIDDVDNDTLYNEIFNASFIYRDNFISMLSTYGMVTTLDNSSPLNIETYPQVTENVLATYYFDGPTYMFYYPIEDETRAIIAYQNDYEIDESLFPYAYSILEKATEVLNEIINPSMTLFEKEKAIYTWMLKNYYDNDGLSTEYPEDEEAKNIYIKTAYGLLNGYYGDCMGWSGTFYTLCNMAGVPCATLDVKSTSEGESGGPSENFIANHRINLIKIDGEYYFVESFWSWQKTDPTDGDYRFMNMTTDIASQYYIWMNEDGFGPILCDYTTYLVDANTGELLNKNN